MIVVEIDKKKKFQKVLGVEYLIKMKKYSNTEYLVKSWIMVIMGIAAFFVTFLQTIYITLIGNDETKIVGDQLKKTDKTGQINFRFLPGFVSWSFSCGRLFPPSLLPSL